MNLLLIVVLALFAGYIIWGYNKGFLRVAYSLVAGIVCIVLVGWVTPYVTDVVVNSTEIDTTIQQQLTVKLQELVADADVDIQLPNVISSEILGEEFAVDGDAAIDEMLQKTGAYEEVALKLALLGISAVSFLLVLVAVKIVLTIVEKMLDFIHKLPLIGGADKILGMAAGALKALIVVWILMAVVALMATTEGGEKIASMIQESLPLAWLYENNLILRLIVSFL